MTCYVCLRPAELPQRVLTRSGWITVCAHGCRYAAQALDHDVYAQHVAGELRVRAK